MKTLRFTDPRRERLFRIFSERHAASRIRLLAATTLLIVLALATGDAVTVTHGLGVILLLRGVMAAAAAGLLVSTFLAGGAGRWSGRVAWAVALLGTAEATLLAVADPAYRQLHAPGMLLIVAFACSALPLRFPHALGLALILDAAYAESLLAAVMAGRERTMQMALLLMSTVLGLLVAHERDGARRRHFLEVLALQSSRSAMARLTDRLRRLSLSDELTGLPNRRELEARLGATLATATRQGSPAVVALLDLDNFKQANDRLGHAGGDALLRQVAAVLARSVRAGDAVFRLGGDELCVLMPSTQLTAGMRVVERGLARVRRVTGRSGFEASFSAGCAESRSGEDGASLLRRADAALYRAKAAGRGRVHGAQPTRALVRVAAAS